MLQSNRFFRSRFFEIAVLILISALVYLPNISKMTYYKDDWYYIHDASIAGPDVFQAMFAIDRPARGPFFEFYYSLFAYHALPYQIGMFIWRILAVTGALWLFNMLWPKNRRIAFEATLLFAIYPGFLLWVKIVENQPIIASLGLQVFSIAFTLKAIQSNRRFVKFCCAAAAILTGWAYIALVDYAIGMEIFRFLCIFTLVYRGQNLINSSIWNTAKRAIRNWLIYLTIPIGFLFWREFLFTNARHATDVGIQLGVFLSNPRATAVSWLVSLIQSVLNVGLFAWVVPFEDNFFSLRLHEIEIAIFVVTIVILIVMLHDYLSGNPAESFTISDKALSSEVLWLGLLGTTFGVLPVVLANRSVIFYGYSHYALPASLAGVVLVIGLVNSISFTSTRYIIMLILIAIASMTHYAVSINVLTQEQAIQQFWWQVAWRAPSIRQGTTLFVNYSSSNIGDNGGGVRNSADLIYYPQKNPAIPVRYTLTVADATDANAKAVLIEHLNRNVSYRSHTRTFDFGNILVLSQPTNVSCVHVIDPKQPLISDSDPSSIQLVASNSKIDNILVNEVSVVPREAIYGPEPSRQWCYYYEKMDLAMQQGNWGEAVALGNKAIELGFYPKDQSEWIPLARAYAIQSDVNGVKMTALKISGDSFLRGEACQLLASSENQPSYTPEIRMLLSQLFCSADK